MFDFRIHINSEQPEISWPLDACCHLAGSRLIGWLAGGGGAVEKILDELRKVGVNFIASYFAILQQLRLEGLQVEHFNHRHADRLTDRQIGGRSKFRIECARFGREKS